MDVKNNGSEYPSSKKNSSSKKSPSRKNSSSNKSNYSGERPNSSGNSSSYKKNSPSGSASKKTKASANRSSDDLLTPMHGQSKMNFTNTKHSSNTLDIIGVCLIIVAIILGIFIYGSTDGWISWISPLFKGLFGVAAYAIPPLMVVFGACFIISDKARISRFSAVSIIIMCFAFMMIIHLSAMKNVLGLKYFEFIGYSYKCGVNGIGGGAICAILSRALIAIIGFTGSIVLLIGVIIVMLLVVSRASLTDLAEKLLNQHRKSPSKAKRNSGRYAKVHDLPDDDFIEHSGRPLTAGDYHPPEYLKIMNEHTHDSNDSYNAPERIPENVHENIPESSPSIQSVESNTAPKRIRRSQPKAVGNSNKVPISESYCTPDDLTIKPAVSTRRYALIHTDRGHTAVDDLTLFPSEGDFKRRKPGKHSRDIRIGESFSPMHKTARNSTSSNFRGSNDIGDIGDISNVSGIDTDDGDALTDNGVPVEQEESMVTLPINEEVSSTLDISSSYKEFSQGNISIDLETGEITEPSEYTSDEFISDIVFDESEGDQQNSDRITFGESEGDQQSNDRNEAETVDIISEAPKDRMNKKPRADGDDKLKINIKQDESDAVPSGKGGNTIISNTISAEVPPELREYRRPPLTLLKAPKHSERLANSSASVKAQALMEALSSFGVNAKLVSICEGPRVIRFEIQLAQGIRVNKVTTLKDDLGVALAASPVRIEAPIPGKTTIGIEIPNGRPEIVLLREVLESDSFRNAKSPLVFALGKDITGNVVTADLSDMPHMLVAGRTGTGKSVCINSIILSIAYRSSPKEVRMILIDPKVVEFKIYAPLPHLFCPVVTDMNRAAGALRWATKEMDKRYNEMGIRHVRGIDRYNELQTNEDDRWPRLVIIIDELSDLMLVAPKDVEESILRISQLGRACGIHLIVATQRPSVDVITGTIKANLPTKIAFAVGSYTDSKVILDGSGAETLLGKGDMIFARDGSAKPLRVQGSLVTDTEVENVMNFFAGSDQPVVEQDEAMIKEINAIPGVGESRNDVQDEEELPDAVRVVIESGKASTSLLQRKLRVGYAKASRLMDIMEQRGYVGAADGAKPRNVLITPSLYREIFGDDRPIGQ